MENRNETQPVQYPYYAGHDPWIAAMKDNAQKRAERYASMTSDQRYSNACSSVGIDGIRSEPVSKRGKALKLVGLPWLEEDLKETGGFTEPPKPPEFDAIINAIPALNHDQMIAVQDSIRDSGKFPDRKAND